MSKIKILGLVLGIGLLLHASLGLAAAKKGSGKRGAATTLYKWVDENGETHYGEVVPPEYADRDKTQLDAKKLMVREKTKKSNAGTEEKTPEQLAAIEQRRKDKALLNTYSNEKEIDLARGRNLQQVEARINSIEMQLKTANDSLKGYNQEQANLKNANKGIPDSLRSDIASAQKRKSNLEIDLKEAREKAAAVRASYDADKARFHALTTGTAN